MGRFWWWRRMTGRCPRPGACSAGAPGERAVSRRLHEQGGHGGRPGDIGFGGVGGTGVVEEVPVSGGRGTGDSGVGAAGEREAGGPQGERSDLEADGGGGQLYSDAAAAGGQAVPDAD